ncbi:MAG: ParB/RepB/Spo0J family partition protein [Clostridia bacterium]|nr:ParB/RepB/Spo0J family partition protein [Clostridia bacterium]
MNIDITKLHGFENHPYKVLDNEEMEQLTESIMQYGVIAPIVVRPKENTADEYEIISGHRRVMACRKAGIEEVPALVVSLDRDAAAIALVDSNLHREHVLPSEKAFAYKMKFEALAHQGKRQKITSDQLGPKLSVEQVSKEDGASQVKRYIRLTHLVPELLQLVDDGRIAFTPAVELSYLTEEEQYALLEEIERNDATPSLSQACRLKRMSRDGSLTSWDIAEIMSEEKANQRERLRIPMERVSRYFPSSFTPNQIEDEIVKLCESNYRKRMSRDER